jgi:uncharacterized membrane protein YfcA
MLSLMLPFSHLEAIATSLVTIIMVTAYNTYSFQQRGVVVWRIVPWTAFSSSLFALIAGKLATILPEKSLIISYILFLFWLALRTFSIKKETSRKSSGEYPKLLPFGIGCFSGFVSGMTGVGGGGITMSLMLVSGLTKNV